MLTEAATTSTSEAAADPASDTAAIDAALAAALRDAPGRPPRLMEAMRYAVLGPGKRLRPRLVLMASRACDGDPADAINCACAVEMIHAYSLVHDDLPAMDDDDVRRGRPTVHRQFDEATAILAGDALLALAFETVIWPPTPVQAAAPACRELAQAAGPGMLVGGQVDDLAGISAASEGHEASLERLEAIHRRKTGAMITVSLRLGALCAGAKAPQLAALTEFGDAIGLLFQVTDDLLDAAGDATAVGKRVGKDQEAGKLTYPGLLGVEASRAYAAELARRASTALQPLGAAAEPLHELTRQILQRDR
jgi:geranylgeranyl diphosphate synthase type II